MLIMIAVVSASAVAAWAALLWWFRRPLSAYWREPVLKVPILIFESDDWGPAPAAHAEALSAIASLLGEFRDRQGRPPVMTLGVILAIPEPTPEGFRQFGELTLSASRFRPVVTAMREGRRAGAGGG